MVWSFLIAAALAAPAPDVLVRLSETEYISDISAVQASPFLAPVPLRWAGPDDAAIGRQTLGQASLFDQIWMEAATIGERPTDFADGCAQGTSDTRLYAVFLAAELRAGRMEQALLLRGIWRAADPMGPQTLEYELAAAEIACDKRDFTEMDDALSRAVRLVTLPSDWWNHRIDPDQARTRVAETLARLAALMHLEVSLTRDPPHAQRAKIYYEVALFLTPTRAFATDVEEALRLLADVY